MTVRDLIVKLGEYNPDAAVEVVVNNYPTAFEVCFGGPEGVSKDRCDDVCFMANCTKEAESR